MTFDVKLAWFWDLYPNQTDTFPWRTDFIFQELLEENSTASRWNMKSIRQRKLFIWEKTSMFWWNSLCSIHCRISYSNLPCAILRFTKFQKTSKKSRISIENQKSKVYFLSNHSGRLVCNGLAVWGSNFISGCSGHFSATGTLQRALNSVTLTGVRGWPLC